MTWKERQEGGAPRHEANMTLVRSDNSSEQSLLRPRDLVPRVIHFPGNEVGGHVSEVICCTTTAHQKNGL